MMLRNSFKKSIAIATAASMTFGMLAAAPIKVNAADQYPESPKRSVIYYGDWSVWGGQGNFYVADVPAEQYTHLNFAFLDFDAQGNLLYTDAGAAIDVPMNQPGVTWGDVNAGILPALLNLRAKYPNCKLGVSVGGWSKSRDFTHIARDPVLLEKFVNNLMKFVKYNDMDFLDINWEYPASVRQPDLVDNKNDEGTPDSIPEDKQNYVTFLRALKDGLNELGQETGKDYELSIALCVAKSVLESGIDVEEVFKIIDFGNLMSYDMTGSWSDISGHQTSLYSNPHHPRPDEQCSTDDTVKYLIEHGAPRDKIVIGAAAYTRGWAKVSQGPIPENPGLFGEAAIAGTNADQSPSRGAINEVPTKVGDGGYLGGIWGFRNLDVIKTHYPGLVEYWDDYAKAPYLYAPNGAFFTYDNERSMKEKAKYVLENGLGGIIDWQASNDKPSSSTKRDTLAKACKEGLYGQGEIPVNNVTYAPRNYELTILKKSAPYGVGVEYEITLKNNETVDETGEVLSSTEQIFETMFRPKLYILSDKPLVRGSYPAIDVTTENGCSVIDLTKVYEYKTLAQGASATFNIKTADSSECDISAVKLVQYTYEGAEPIRDQVLFDNGANKPAVFSGITDKTIEVGQSFDPMAGVTANDPEDGDRTANISVTGTVDNTKAGIYTLTYKVSDSEGLEVTETRTITVEPANTPPVFSGVSDITIKVGQSFDRMAGVTAQDAEDGTLTQRIEVTGTVNTSAEGVYPIQYSVVDNKGLRTSVTRLVKVIPPVNLPPEFSGIFNKTIKFGETFDKLAGITATDDEDGDVTSDIVVTGTVNIMQAGNYVLTYKVSDSKGLETTKERTITVLKPNNTPPVLSGVFDKTIQAGQVFDPMAGILAIDNEDGNITNNVQVTGTVDTSNSGVYPLTYKVADNDGLETTAIRIITVGKPQSVNTAPKLSGVSNKTIKVGELIDKLAGVTAIDAEDGDLTNRINVLGSVNRMNPGTYTLTYSVSDSKGLKDTATCTVTVERDRNTAPVLNGVSDKIVKLGEAFDKMEGITATDAEDGNITGKIIVIGNVNTSRTGFYTLTYIVVDNDGASASAKRVITVRKTSTRKPGMR